MVSEGAEHALCTFAPSFEVGANAEVVSTLGCSLGHVLSRTGFRTGVALVFG